MKSGCNAVITHPSSLFRDGLQRILAQTAIKVLYSGPSIDDELLDKLRPTPSVIWIIGADEVDEAIEEQWRRARAKLPRLKAVMLARHCSLEQLLKVVNAGFSGYVDQQIECERLTKMLQVVISGDTALQGQLLDGVALSMDRRGDGHSTAGRDWRCMQTRHDRILRPREFAVTTFHTPRIASMDHTVAAGTQIDVFGAEDLNGANPDRALSSADMALSRLSNREKVILHLLTEGASNKIIANRIDVTEATVKVHIKSCLRKLRLHNRTQAAIWASRHLLTVEASNERGGDRTQAKGA
jgi:two-component system nitrate/nitrite response regulator NarL